MEAERLTLADALRTQRRWCAELGSPLYADILDGCVDDVQHGHRVTDAIGHWEGDPERDLLALRMLGAVHRIVLRGDAPELAAHYPSTGGTPNASTAAVFLDTLEQHTDEVRAAVARPPQTNEVRRSVVLLGGFLEIMHRWPRPLELLELGSSAGVNLLWDQFGYRLGSQLWGDHNAPVQLSTDWRGDLPPLPTASPVVRRAGCDLQPQDASHSSTRLTLESFVWPDQDLRRANLRAALDMAAAAGFSVDAARAAEWLPPALADASASNVVVVFHSIVWTYLSDEERTGVEASLAGAGAARSPQAPLCWLRFEPNEDGFDLRLTHWPAGETRILADAHAHGAWVRWRKA